MENNLVDLIRLLDNNQLKNSGRIALVFGARKITYNQLISSSKKLASSLSELGIKRGDRVALWLPNCPEFVYSFFAILRLGAIVVPINTMLKREEVKFMVEDSLAKIMICSADKFEDSENILSRLESLTNIISLPRPKDSKIFLDFNQVLKRHPEFDKKIQIDENDLAEIVYTSGTTGKPKGACLSHKNLISNIKDCAQVISFSKKDTMICILPLFHSFSSTVCMLLPLYKGAKIVIMRAIRPFKRVMRTIFKHRVTVFVGVPPIYKILSEVKVSFLKRIINIIINPVRLYISGAAALPSPVWRRFEKKFKRPLLQGYGLTEASPVVSLNPLKGRRKPDSIGLVIPSVKVRVVDKEDKDLPCDKVGELLVKGPNVMQGYYNAEGSTNQALKNNWLYTGDLAKIDEEGFIYIMGRSKDMINVRGFNVYPREIEDLLYKGPHIKEAAVIGVMHKYRGEVPVAFVVSDSQVNEREILNYLKTNLASYKIPLKVIVKDELPKNATGKILKRKLQEEIKGIFE